jgi:protein-tyrosine-phosphatase
MLFVCTHNSARSQLAAAIWTARTGRRARSAGTRPATRVHRGAVAAAKRAGLSLADAVPTALGEMPSGVQVVTVCDLVHEELDAAAEWWHWSIPDPVERGDAAAFDAVVVELEERMTSVVGAQRGDVR